MEKSKRMSLFTENGDLTDNKMVHGMFLGRLGISCDDMDIVLNGEKTLGELVEGSNVKEVEVIKEVPVEKVVEVVKEVPVPVEVEKVVEKEIVKSVTIEDVIDYITRDNVNVVPIIDALRQCNYLSINDNGKALKDYDLDELALYVLQNASKTFLLSFYTKLGDLIKNSAARIIDPYDVLTEEKINSIIDGKSDPEKAKEYFSRYLQKDTSVPILSMVKTLTFLPTADIRNARTLTDLTYYYDEFRKILENARVKRSSAIYDIIDFTFTAKQQPFNKLNGKHKISHFDRTTSPIERVSYMLKARVEKSKYAIESNIKSQYKNKFDTFLKSLSDILGVEFVINLLKELGFTNVDDEVITNRLFILNYSNSNLSRGLLTTNNSLFTECTDLMINDLTIYDYYLTFVKILFERVDDRRLSDTLRCLVGHKIIFQIMIGTNTILTKICSDAFKRNSELFGWRGTKLAELCADIDWKDLDGITNPMVAYNKYISSVELSQIFKCTTGDIMSACKNYNHWLNNPGDWKRGTIAKIARACADHFVNVRVVSRLYKDPLAGELVSLRNAFPKEVRRVIDNSSR